MASSAGFFARFLFVVILSTGITSTASAQQAADRCEGTLCDLYYGANGGNTSTPQPGAPAGATPLTVPKVGFLSNIFGGGGSQQTAAPTTGAPVQATAPARAPFVQVGGGGVLGMARGAPAERCGGSLCDFFYGGPSPEEQREAQQAETPQPTQAALAPGAMPAPDEEPRTTRRRGVSRERGGVDYAREPAERPQCVAPPGDPWRCYRK